MPTDSVRRPDCDGPGGVGLWPLTRMCSITQTHATSHYRAVQNSLYVQVLRSPILAALLPGTPAAIVSQTLRHGTRNASMELSQRVPHVFGWAAIMLGCGPHSSWS